MSGDDEAMRAGGADLLAGLSAPREGWRARLEEATGGLAPIPSRLVVALGAMVLLVAGVWIVAARAGSTAPEPLPFTTPSARGARAGTTAPGSAGTIVAVEAAGTTVPTVPTVWVSATGAVERPGLYHLRGGARLSELLVVAGGLTPDADQDRINLAAILRDGERLYLPRRGEVAAPGVIAGGPPGGSVDATSGVGAGVGSGGSRSGPGNSSGPSVEHPLNLNTASGSELVALPGVGPATAAAITEYRDRHGPFASVDDLRLVRGIGPAKLDALRGLVVV